MPEAVSQVAAKCEAIGKRLEARSLTNGNNPRLRVVVMDVTVRILREVGRHGPGRPFGQQFPKAFQRQRDSGEGRLRPGSVLYRECGLLCTFCSSLREERPVAQFRRARQDLLDQRS